MGFGPGSNHSLCFTSTGSWLTARETLREFSNGMNGLSQRDLVCTAFQSTHHPDGHPHPHTMAVGVLLQRTTYSSQDQAWLKAAAGFQQPEKVAKLYEPH